LSRATNNSGPVIFVLPSLDAGGAERIIINLANEMSSQKETYLANIRFGGELQDLVQEGVHRIWLKNKFIWLVMLLWQSYKIKPRYLISTNFDINAVLILFRWLLPSCCNLIVREPTPVYAASISSKLPLLRKFAYKYLYQYTDKLVVLSDEMKTEFIELNEALASKITVINNGVNLVRVNNINASSAEPLPEKYIVTVGRLVHEKGYDILVPAFKNIQQEFPEYKLFVIGDGPQRTTLQKMIVRLGLSDRIKLLGYRENPSAVVMRARLFVLSSRCEGLSNAMLEALCLGVPVLAIKNHTGVQGIVEENRTGFLVDECSVSSLAEGLLRALNKEKEIDRVKLASWACDRFTQANLVLAYDRLMRSICGDID